MHPHHVWLQQKITGRGVGTEYKIKMKYTSQTSNQMSLDKLLPYPFPYLSFLQYFLHKINIPAFEYK